MAVVVVLGCCGARPCALGAVRAHRVGSCQIWWSTCPGYWRRRAPTERECLVRSERSASTLVGERSGGAGVGPIGSGTGAERRTSLYPSGAARRAERAYLCLVVFGGGLAVGGSGCAAARAAAAFPPRRCGSGARIPHCKGQVIPRNHPRSGARARGGWRSVGQDRSNVGGSADRGAADA